VASQNVFLGLPITLMQEETAWLVLQGTSMTNLHTLYIRRQISGRADRQGIAHLVPLPTSPLVGLPPKADIEAYNAARQARIRAQQQRQRAIEEQKSREGKAKFAAAGEAARAKREARAKAKADKERARRIAEGEIVDDIESQGGTEVKPAAEPVPISNSALTTNDTPPEPAPVSSLEPISGTHFHTIPPVPFFPPSTLPRSADAITSLPHPLFPFPSSERDRALVSTFSHLHDRGLRVGLGPRFGGEYLVYPGDYLRYHAHFTSQVIVDDEPITPGQIVAWGRLGTGTKKAGLLCCWTPSEKCEPMESEETGDGDHEQVDADLGEVEFYSLEWASFG
jgi:tRNA-splicing endonuclease subunit Sen34